MTAAASPPARPHRRKRQRPRTGVAFQPEHQWLLWEIIFKLGLNALFIVGASLSILRLLPYQQIQQAKLEDVRLQVRETERRVEALRRDFSRSFDPGQSRKLMEEVSPRLDPNQRQVILTPPPGAP
ncbi:MAG: hypothetical protein VKN60_05250 [Cyanobacteriota bacterium]|nr:hypothetical protein [Cyanobacteriota bacterium]